MVLKQVFYVSFLKNLTDKDAYYIMTLKNCPWWSFLFLFFFSVCSFKDPDRFSYLFRLSLSR